MTAFQKILFPVDMSDSCTAAVPFVEALVKKFNAELTLLHVLEMPPGYVTDWYGYMALVDTDAVRGGRRSEFDLYLKDKFDGLNVGRVMVEGDAATEINEFAREHGTDLIMIRHTDTESSQPAAGIGDRQSVARRGLSGMDRRSRRRNTARHCGLRQYYVRRGSYRHESSNDAVRIETHSGFQSQAVPGARRSWAETKPEKYFDADLQGLLVIGRGHATRALGRLRTNVYSIIRQSPCPVISV